MKRVALLLFFGVGVLACDKPKLPDDTPKLPELPVVSLPKLPDGKSLLFEIHQARLELDPTVRDPLTGLGACADAITYCFDPGTSPLDECVRQVPRCRTSKPWEESQPCCPEQCIQAYRANRTTDEPFVAFEKAFFGERSCYPGVAELVGGAR